MASAVAPVKVENGYLVIAMIAAWLSAWLADGLAFRAAALIEPLVPPALVFIFVSGLAGDRLRILSAVIWLATALLAYAVLRARQNAGSAGWLTAHRRGALVSSLRLAALLGVVALLLGVVLGPSLPGAGSSALLTPNESGSSRTQINPLVDIRGRITSTSDVELFTVRSTEPAYWRLLSLDHFDGTTWSSDTDYKAADSDLSGGVTDAVPKKIVVQQYIITTLDSAWLPAAYTPSDVSGVSGIPGVDYNSATSTLVAQGSDISNAHYIVTSEVPEVDPTTLRAATGAPPADIAATYLDLPANFPTQLRDVARQITANATTPFDKALALQNYFRDNFTYDLSVNFGHSDKAIEEFLAAKRGYCEQFAGSYAALARAIGLPTRVAVGFTPGTLEVDGQYHVLDKHAHAWPEVYFAGIGWLPFEPTPSRGNPDAASYTGVAAAQVDQPGTQNTTNNTSAASPGTTTADGGNNGATATSLPTNPAKPVHRGASAFVQFLVFLLIIMVAVALWMALIALVSRSIWRYRRAKADGPAGRALVEWGETTDALARAGVRAAASDTPFEVADRALAARVLDRNALHDMADTATRAAYGRAGVEDADVARIRHHRKVLERRLWSEATWRDRLRWLTDPRPLLRRA
jgi:transglutaminase-like putative cysteine protease